MVLPHPHSPVIPKANECSEMSVASSLSIIVDAYFIRFDGLPSGVGLSVEKPTSPISFFLWALLFNRNHFAILKVVINAVIINSVETNVL